MITLAAAEYLKDPLAIAAVKKAEAESGFRTGVRFSAAGRHLIEVSFRPETRFWIVDIDEKHGYPEDSVGWPGF